MARQTGVEAVRQAVDEAVTSAGLYLEDVVVAQAGSRSVVRIVVDLPEDQIGALDLDSVAEVSRDVSAALDAADAVAGAYTLEVSTPGTGRLLTSARHFKRARTRIVRVALRDGSSVAGRLLDVDDALHLDDGAGVQTIALDDVASGTMEVELTRSATEEHDLDDEEA